MVRQCAVFSAAWLFATISTAQAATVTVIQGEALLSHGNGYEAIRGASNLVPGDTVVAKPGSSAKITFSNGCTVFLGMGMVFSVPAEPPCGPDSGAAPSNPSVTTNVGTQEAGALPAKDWSAATQTTLSSAEAPPNVLPYLLGAAAIGGISAAAIGLSGGGGSGTPTSP
jgi:hypothetical protein